MGGVQLDNQYHNRKHDPENKYEVWWSYPRILVILSLKYLDKELLSESWEGRETEAFLCRVLFIQFQSWQVLSELLEITCLYKIRI